MIGCCCCCIISMKLDPVQCFVGICNKKKERKKNHWLFLYTPKHTYKQCNYLEFAIIYNLYMRVYCISKRMRYTYKQVCTVYFIHIPNMCI